jgi:phosphatidate cytidylyltransferase
MAQDPLRAVILVVLACFGVGGVLLLMASRSAAAAEQRSRGIKYLVYFAIVMAVLGAAHLGRSWFLGLLLLIVAEGIVEIAAALRLSRIRGGRLDTQVWLGYGALAGACVFSLRSMTADAAAFIYVVVAAFDGFSQVTGQLLGRHPLAPRISPGKTTEGTAGGTIGALSIAVLTRGLAHLPLVQALETGVLVCLAGLTGDLAASWLKRRAGLKDFGCVLPGHGGVLDRFDSYLAALALCGPWLIFLGA